MRENPSSSSEVTLLTIWESTLLGHVLAPRGCWIRTDSQASILGCGDSLTARELNRTSGVQKEGREACDVEGVVYLVNRRSVLCMDAQQQEKLLHKGGFK